jgi:hypothetical protein
MRQACRISILAFAVALLLAPQSFAQSLGDVAREHRAEEKAKAGKDKPKVFTNDNLPAHSDDSSNNSGEKSPASAAAPGPDDSAEGREIRGEQWKDSIRAQKNAIAKAQAELDKFNASIHFVEANRYSNGVEYNQYQARKQEEAQHYQEQLNEAKQKLQDMQESARREGFGSSIYDP